ncbi:MAG: dTDP-4-dehydrorhamnose reductase [Phycisphaerales bacterium]|nr:dTDP-4-dehydrorhamnose reductase [Phycisphaerales bacterium]
MGTAAPLSGPVVVLGSTGMLGRAVTSLLRAREATVVTPARPEFDLGSRASIDRAIDRGTAVVINCAAYTDVDGAEAHPAAARAANATGVGWIAERCRAVNAVLVHFSTDYVFDGRATSPYLPSHPKHPMNEYGRSKSEGEDAIAASGAGFLLLRTSWLYAPWSKNFVRTIARIGAERPVLKVVNDQRGRPTSAEHLAETTLAMVAAGARGVHHAADGGECTWFEFASAIVRGLSLPGRVEPCTTAEFPRPAPRPGYSVLDVSSTEAIIGRLRPWGGCLADVLERLERPL